MEFRILGPLEVLDDGQSVDIGAAKQRALLARLLLDPNRVVSSDLLIDALWGERAPETATKALQVYVSNLRKALGKERIVTRSPGYELHVAPGELDAERFQELVADGRFDDALALWRGAPLADLAYEAFAQPEIARLEALRLACVEERIERELGRGLHGALVGELEALVRRHPLRERLRGQLMVALYRSGRQADALDVYQAGRRLLADELGLEPSTELRELQRAILEQDPALDGSEAAQPSRRASSLEVEELSMPTTVREVRKAVTVLVCDLVGTDPALDPEAKRRMLERALDELVHVLERHGATVEPSIGGSLTAVFGVPVVHEDDALRAVRAAQEMHERLAALRGELERRWGAWVDLRAGIGTGEVLTGGDMAESARLLGTGAPPVEAALALHAQAGPGERLVDERTYRLVRDAVEAESLDGHARLLGLNVAPAGFESRFESPMIGRKRERRRLRDAFEQAVADRSCQLFTILGAPGVGKSRLVQEFIGEVAGGGSLARGRCLPYGEGITYWPLVEAVRDVAELTGSESTEESLEKLEELVAETDDASRITRRLGEVLGLIEETGGAEETFWAVRSFLEALARGGPLVIVFDDIHWGEPTFLDLVDHLAEWTRDAAVLLVCVARPELLDVRPHWGGGKVNSTSALLQPLTDAESEELVANLASAIEIDETERRRIVEAAGGNPLFVEEMLALVLEEEEEEEDATPTVPPTIQALLAARLDRLAAGERAAIEAAAVEGKVFHEGSVADLVGVPTGDVHERLLTLVRRELVRPDRPVFSGERAFAFRHLLIRDAAYDSIPKETRAVLHERHATWLERKAGDRALEVEEIIAYHLEQAYRHRVDLGPIDDAGAQLGRRAAERLGAAGQRAFARGDAPAAVNLISRAVALLAPDDPLRVDLVPNVRVVQGLTGDLLWAERVLSEAIAAGNERLKTHAHVQRGFLRLFTQDVTPQELFEVSDEAIGTFEPLGDELGLARAWRLVGQAHYLARRAEASAEAAERALEHARRAGDRFEEREIVEWLLISLLFGPCTAQVAIDRCLRLVEEVAGEPGLEAMVAATMAWLEMASGHRDAALDLIARGHRAVEEAGELAPVMFHWGAGSALTMDEDWDAAERELRPTYEALRTRGGTTGHFGAVAVLLAPVYYGQGRYDEAYELTQVAEEASRANDVGNQTLWRTTRATILARRGELDDAVALAAQGMQLASDSDFLRIQGEAALDVAEVMRLAERPDEARAAAEQAIGLFERKGNSLSAGRARQYLAHLTMPA